MFDNVNFDVILVNHVLLRYHSLCHTIPSAIIEIGDDQHVANRSNFQAISKKHDGILSKSASNALPH